MAEQSSSPADPKRISWPVFEEEFVADGLPVLIPIPGTPEVRIFLDKDAERMGIEIDDNETDLTKIRPMQRIDFSRDGGTLTIATEEQKLFAPFYAFMLRVSVQTQESGWSTLEAIKDSLEIWRGMVAYSTGMDHRTQLGLSGELWLLERLIKAQGADVVQSWTGCESDKHDFRFADKEIEVKTTMRQVRRHRVSRLDQLQASPAKELWLLSVQMMRAGSGSGWRLCDQISKIRVLLSGSQRLIADFESKLAKYGWLDADEALYPARRSLSSPSRLVLVDDELVRLTPSLLVEVLGKDAVRIEDVEYDLNVEGLGVEDGTEAFLNVLPKEAE